MTLTSWSVILTIQLAINLCESKIQLGERKTEDPISNILENIIVVDVSKYLPQGYILRKEVSDEYESVDQNEEVGEEDDESSNKALSSVETPKYQGRIFSAINKGKYLSSVLDKEVKELTDENESSDQYQEVGVNVDKSSNKAISSVETPKYQGRLFSAIHKGESLSSVLEKEVKELTSTSTVQATTRTTTTTTSTSTTTWRGPPPGTCYRGQPVCSLAGNVLVVSGLSWEEELAYPGSVVFQREADSLARELSRGVQLGYFGTDLNFIDIQGFLNRSEGVLVDFYIEFRGFNHDVGTDDIGEAFKENAVPGDEVKMFGDYGIDTSTAYFVVVDPLVLEKLITENETLPSQRLPDWAWLVISGGTISTIIIVMIGTIDGYMRYKRNSVLRGLNSTKLDGLKELMETTRNVSEVDLRREEGVSYRQGKDRRDIWTLQRIKEQEDRKQKTFHHSTSGYPLTPGSCGGDSLQEDTVVRNKDQKDVTEILKRGFQRTSFGTKGQSTYVSNLNLLEEESFESVSGDSDDQIVNNLVFI